MQVGLPGPLGMILTGIAVGNISNGHLVKGLPASWSKELRAIALAIIFLRSGLELDLRVSNEGIALRSIGHSLCLHLGSKGLLRLLLALTPAAYSAFTRQVMFQNLVQMSYSALGAFVLPGY